MTIEEFILLSPWLVASIVIVIIEIMRGIRTRKLEQVNLEKEKFFNGNYSIQSERFIYWVMMVAFTI